ncbi:GNAT family N-acetyltransferase [Bacillus tianshenii]|nr:GNAT family N-acetyltransferase [Bacillus tianshenii]
MKIRPANEKDSSAIAKLKNHLFETTPYFFSSPGEYSTSTEDEMDELNEVMGSGGIIFVVEIDSQIVGYLRCSRSPLQKLRHICSLFLGLHEQSRGHGIGKELIKAAIDWAKTNGIEKIFLGVLSTNTSAINLYQSFGFEEEGRQRDYIKFSNGTYADDLIMALRLK